jgi:hypothetical protein
VIKCLRLKEKPGEGWRDNAIGKCEWTRLGGKTWRMQNEKWSGEGSAENGVIERDGGGHG